MRPIDGAESVVLDPVIRARYPGDPDVLDAVWERFESGGEPLIKLIKLNGDDTADRVAGTLRRGGDRVIFFEPERGLSAGASYQLGVASPATTNLGYETFMFETGFREDEEPPELTIEDDGLSLFVSESTPECGPEGTVNVGIDFPEATDDGDPSSIEHFVYLTRARGLSAPRLVARVGRPYSEPKLNFVLTPEEAEAPVCLRVRAMDGKLKLAENEPEICFDPVQGSFFRPLCAVTTPGRARGHSHSHFAGVFLLLSAFAWRRRRGLAIGRGRPETPAATVFGHPHRNRPHA